MRRQYLLQRVESRRVVSSDPIGCDHDAAQRTLREAQRSKTGEYRLRARWTLDPFVAVGLAWLCVIGGIAFLAAAIVGGAQ